MIFIILIAIPAFCTHSKSQLGPYLIFLEPPGGGPPSPRGLGGGKYLAPGLLESDGSIIVPATQRSSKGKIRYPIIKIIFAAQDLPLHPQGGRPGGSDGKKFNLF